MFLLYHQPFHRFCICLYFFLRIKFNVLLPIFLFSSSVNSSCTFIRGSCFLENTLARFSSKCFFHCLIWLEWILYRLPSSGIVFSPLIASNATLALKLSSNNRLLQSYLLKYFKEVHLKFHQILALIS